MTVIATNVYKKLAFRKQASQGTIAVATAGGAQYLRRVSSTLDVTKGSFTSAEILDSQQRRDMRHGVKQTGGTLNGELSVGTYQQFFESVCRKLSTALPTTGAVATITATSTGTNTGTFVRSAGSFITDGFNIGDIVNTTGWATTATANNNQYMMITALTATTMTCVVLDGTPIVAKAAGDNVTILGIGKKTWMPASGQTRDYYTIEHWYGDIAQSEVFVDTVVGGATINLPPTGMATVSFPLMGLNMTPGQAQYFQAPVAASTGRNLAGVNGVLILNGSVIALVSGMSIDIKGNYAYPSGDGVVGSNLRPDVLPGVMEVTGQITLLFTDTVGRDAFLNETECSLAVALTGDNSAMPAFVAFVMSRIKFSGATKDDAATGLTQTLPYTALENVITGGTNFPNIQTTISIQDSAFV